MNNRIGFIGGSDAVRIMNGDWVKLWSIKTGREEPEDLSDNFTVQSGIHNEKFILHWFEKIHKESLVDHQKTYEMNWSGVPLKGTIDAATQSRAAIVEAKETYEYNKMEDQLARYMPQLQFYMMISNTPSCYFANKFGNRRWECVYIKKDWEYIHKMQVHLKEFWRHVKEDTRPFGDDQVAPISIDKIPVDGMVRRDASSDNEFISRCHDYLEQEQSAKLFESAKSDLKAMVGDNEREVYCDLLTIKRDKRGSLRIMTKEN
mgnify:CR=1 FL=1